MTPKVEVSRQFEPVPELAIEARYRFSWNGDGELRQVDLSKRKVKPGSSINSQFDKVEDIGLSKVPDDVVNEAAGKLRACARNATDANDSAE